MSSILSIEEQESFKQMIKDKHPTCKFKIDVTNYQGNYYNKVLYCIVGVNSLVATINSRKAIVYAKPLVLDMSGREFLEI